MLARPCFWLFTLLGLWILFPLETHFPLNDYNEWNIVHFAAKFLPKHPVVVQAGSHHKNNLSEMSYFWPAGSIHVFEPNPLLFAELKQFLEHCRLHIHLYPVALSDVSGNALFYTDSQGANPKAGSLLPASDPWKWYYKETSVFSVPCICLEEWAAEHHIRSIDLLWLNTGGTELRILKSISSLLPTVQILVLETYDQEFRSGTSLYPEVRKFLESMGFVQIQRWNVPHFQGMCIFVHPEFLCKEHLP
jgi:FkbM family methyltransferase